MRHLLLILLAACGDGATSGTTWQFPDEGPATNGPGAPARAFQEAELFVPCAFLDGGANDADQHGAATPFDGWLLLPWGEPTGGGGLSLFDLTDPCAPVEAGHAESPALRSTRAIAFALLPDGDHAGRWAVTSAATNAGGGVLFWNLDDSATPQAQGALTLDGYVGSGQTGLAWAYPWVYAAMGDGRVTVIDATDPTAPVAVRSVRVDDGMLPGEVIAFGTRLLVTADHGARAAFFDLSWPDSPSLLPGSPFDLTDRDGVPRAVDGATWLGDKAWFSRAEAGGGPIRYDVSDPLHPVFDDDHRIASAGGGALVYDEGYVFVGGSTRGDVIEAIGPTLYEEGDITLTGDVRALTPYGSVAILSADGATVDGEASAVFPWNDLPDQAPPIALAASPADGEATVSIHALIGVVFNEVIEPVSAFEGAVRLFKDDDDTPVRGWLSAQGPRVSYAPREPLLPHTTYRVEVVAQGVADPNGNAVTAPFTSRFTTAE